MSSRMLSQRRFLRQNATASRLSRGLSLLALPLLLGFLPTHKAGCESTGGVTADELLAVTSSCTPLSGVSKFATDSGGTANISMCGLDGAIFFKADMDIDCDGGSGSECQADPYYQAETSCVDSSGDPIDASTLPFIVLPLDSNGFYVSNYGIKCGSVAAVVYGNQVIYGVLADRGPKGVVGEASYAMAEALGIPSSPISGGVSSGVTYIVFTDSAVASPIDSHSAATSLGEELAAALVANN